MNFSGGNVSSSGGLASYGVAAGGGALAASGLMGYQQTKSDAKLAKWTSIGTAAVYALAGNSAMGSANNAMTSINSVAGATYTTDIPAIKSAIQSLATGLQNVTPGGYLGVSTATLPLATPSSAAATPATNNGIALLAVGIIAALALTK